MTEARRYEVLAVLGRGGFGTVYHARFLGEGGFRKEVALKVLNPDMEGVAEIASRLRDEARVLGLIRHRAIVGVDRLTQLDGRWTVVMEYIEGHDLGRLLGNGPLPVTVALEVVAEIAGALHAAYSRVGPGGQPLRLLHRDLKPSNVRITPYGEVKVLDFGIARAEFGEREAETRSLFFGTPEYMSPERLDLVGDDASGDVYALGAILFELLVGARFGRTSANPARHARKLEEAAAALQGCGVPAPTVALLGRMLCFEAGARPTATEVERQAAALARAMGGPSLREWVDDLDAALPVTVEATDDLTGSILVERAEPPAPGGAGTAWERGPAPAPDAARPPPSPVRLPPAATGRPPAGPSSPVPPAPVVPAPAPPRPTPPAARPAGRAPWLALGGAVVLLLVVGAVAVVLWWSGRGPAPLVEEAPPQVTQNGGQPAVSAVAVTAAPKEAAAVTNDAGATVQKEEPRGEAASESAGKTATPTAAETAKARAAPATVSVGLTGDATSASLVSTARGGKRYRLPSSEVPTGSYQIFAAFDGGSETQASQKSIKVGQNLTVHCDSQFGMCTVSEAGP